MPITYEDDQVEYSPHDICLAVWMPLNCDGTVVRSGPDPTDLAEDPVLVSQCGLTAVTLNKLVSAPIEDIDPSGQANVNSGYRRIKPTVTGWQGVADVSARVSPLVLSLLDQAAPIVDTDHANVVFGHEEAITVAEGCPSCGRLQGTCSHSVALMTIHNAWCGTVRHPQYPFVALFHKSLDLEPIATSKRRGRGFSPTQYSWTLQTNAAFVEPFGIDPRGVGSKARWMELPIHVDRIDPAVDTAKALLLRGVLDGCDCGACESPLT